LIIENESPILIHIHIPKCGGSSFRSVLARQFGSHHLNLYVDDTHFVYPESYLADTVRNAQVSSISSHFIRSFPPQLGGRPVHYVTFLRHPLDQFLSYRNYICKVFHDLRDAALLEYLPARANELTSREFARWVLTESPQNAPFRENFTTNFLAREVFRRVSGDGADYRSSRLPLAKDALRKFLFVGLTEELATCFPRFVQAAAERGFPLRPDTVPVENVTHQFTDDTSWMDPNDAVGALLFASIEVDLELYTWARSHFGNEATASGLTAAPAQDADPCGRSDGRLLG